MSAPADEWPPDRIRDLESSFTQTGSADGPSFSDQLQRIVDFQKESIPTYGRYLRLLGESAIQTPHLPIESFRREALCAVSPDEVDAVFTSSGTTSEKRSRHFVYKLGIYEKSIRSSFERRFGSGPFTLVAYLPGYEEAGSNSSLLYMLRCLIRSYGDEESGFFHSRIPALHRVVDWSSKFGTRLILFGVAFGLLDLIDVAQVRLGPGSLVVETGGMKTRRREISRGELHERLAIGFDVPRDHVLSEYGMSEMLSQCYTRGGETFYPPPWVRVEVRDPEDPYETVSEGQPGALAIIDLANMYSISAILTEDVGVLDGDGFRVLGRLRGAQLRGCNMLLDSMR